MGNDMETACAETQDDIEQTATAESSAAASDGAQDEVQEADDVESLRTALQEAQEQLADAEDRALRAVAEAENVRKRAERSIDSARKFALEKFVADMLPAVDSFERASQASNEASGEDATAAIAEGIELSLKLLLEAMQRQGIEVVDPIGAPFDPNLHEAMSMVESASAEPGSVLEVFQKGYTVNGRLARPARVIVAKEPAPKAAEGCAKDG